MASEVQICNLALQKLGQPALISLADNTRAGRECSNAYGPARDAVLRDHVWNFAVERAELAELSTAPAWGYAAQYQMPSDCLRLLEVEDDNLYPWKLEGGKILTDAPAPIYIKYLKRVTDTTQFDSLFIHALASRLAYELAEALTQSNTKKDAAAQDYSALLRMAKKADGQENTPDDRPEDDWVTVRD